MVIFSESELFGLGSTSKSTFLASIYHPITIQWDGKVTRLTCLETDRVASQRICVPRGSGLAPRPYNQSICGRRAGKGFAPNGVSPWPCAKPRRRQTNEYEHDASVH